jgi:hypothetical protein
MRNVFRIFVRKHQRVHHLVQLLSISEKFFLRRDCGFSRLRMGYIGGLLRKTLPHTVVWLVCVCVIMCESVSYLLMADRYCVMNYCEAHVNMVKYLQFP